MRGLGGKIGGNASWKGIDAPAEEWTFSTFFPLSKKAGGVMQSESPESGF